MVWMKVILQIGGRTFAADADRAVSLARLLDFESQDAEFGAPPPNRRPLQLGRFVGDTQQGGGCNVDQLSLIPHCHGTHTETVGHIVDQQVPIAEAQLPVWMICALLTVTPQASAETDEDYQPPPRAGDVLMTAAGLKNAYEALAANSAEDCHEAFVSQPVKALIVRCPSSARSPQPSLVIPPYFSTAAIRWCNQLGVHHLLVDSPSIDRLEDDGQLTNHHAYWNVPAGTHTLSPDSWTDKSITESIAVDPQVADGIYLLNLQVPAFCSDAAPSRPVILPLQSADREDDEGVL